MWRNRAAGRWLKLAAGVTLSLILLAALVGYAIFRKQTPVSLEEAIDRFRAGNDRSTSDAYKVSSSRKQDKGKPKPSSARMRIRNDPSTEPLKESLGDAVGDATGAAIDRDRSRFNVMPAEGVYTYVGRGEESIDPVPARHFPRVTQRIITHEDQDTWVEHHIFSEERASWSRHSTSQTRRVIHHQRNFIKIGPHDEDKTVPFHPPIQTAGFPYRPRERWEGRFTGQTNDGEHYTGTYAVEAVEDEKWDIGGTKTRVLGFEFFAEFVGEFNGTVKVNYWYAPRYGVTVREEYYADAQVGPLRYWGEWFVRLRSLHPAT